MPGSHRQSCKKRRRYVARLYISGLSQFEIAVWLEISQATVSRDLREAGRDLRNPAVRRLRQADEAALAHVDQLEWKLWKLRDQVRQDFFTPRIVHNPRTGRETETRWITGVPGGDPRFLDWLWRCAELRQRIHGRMQKRQLRGTVGIQKGIMRIEAAVESLRRRYVGQISQPAESGAPQVREPASSTPGHEVAKDEARVSDVADWKTCPTTDDGERRGVSPPVCTQASHRSSRAKTRRKTCPRASATRRSPGGLTSRRSPGAPIGRFVFRNYAKTLAGICGQTSAGQLVATKSTARSSTCASRPLDLASSRSRGPLTPRQRGPPPVSDRLHLRFPLSALRFAHSV